MFRIEMMPAREGDCLLVTYGDAADPRRVLIDGGRAATWPQVKARLQALPGSQREFEVLVVTHVDRDHIEGILKMVEDEDLPVRFKDVWFNGYHHLLGECLESFGPVQGERLSMKLMGPGWRWNGAFESCPVCLQPDGALPSVALDGGMTLTVLSPDRAKLQALKPEWEKEVSKAGLVPGQAPEEPEHPEGYEALGGPVDVDSLADAEFKEDAGKPNGSSIAVIAEFNGRRALLTGDAHPSQLVEALRPLAEAAEDGRLRLDAVKLSHHGSQRNLSADLLELLDCRLYLISTNGDYFQHPDREAVARVIKYGGPEVTLAFNYRSEETEVWKSKKLRDRWGYRAIYPPGDNGYLAVDL